MRLVYVSSDVCSSDLRDADQAGDRAIHRDEHHGLAIATQILCLAGEVTSVHAKVIYQARVAERDPPAFNRADDSLAGGRIEVFGIRELEFALFRRLDDGGCKRVLARSLPTGRD